MAAIRFRVLARSNNQVQADKRRQQWNKTVLVTLFALPGMVVFLLFLLIPISESVPFSFYKWNGLGPMTDFIGFQNYTNLLSNSIFQTSLLHSTIIMTLSLGIQLPLALGLALLLGRGDLRGRRLFRGVMFIPFVFSEIITAIIWAYVLHPDGLLNLVLQTLIPNTQPISWLGDRRIVLLSVFAVITWKYFGCHMILYMAGLQSISKDVEE